MLLYGTDLKLMNICVGFPLDTMPTVNFVGSTRHLFEGIDTDINNYMDLCEAIYQLVIGREFDQKNMDLVVVHEIPGSEDREIVDDDKSYMEMVSRYGEDDTINIHYSYFLHCR